MIIAFILFFMLNNSFIFSLDNSLLLIEELSKENINELFNILNSNKNKIKAIIIDQINNEDNEDILTNYMDKFDIPLYQLKNHLFDKITKFFIEGEGGAYIPDSPKQPPVSSDIITIYRPLYFKSNDSSREKKTKENTATENLDDNKNNKNCTNLIFDENVDDFFYGLFNDEIDKKKISQKKKKLSI